MLPDQVSVDFTASSGDRKSPESFHYISPDGINEYLIAIWSVGSVVQNYDTYVMILTDLVTMSKMWLEQLVLALHSFNDWGAAFPWEIPLGAATVSSCFCQC